MFLLIITTDICDVYTEDMVLIYFELIGNKYIFLVHKKTLFKYV